MATIDRRVEDYQRPFSVVMAVYAGDNPLYIIEAVDSILAQSVVPTEVVIAVDGPVSSDTDALLMKLGSRPRFKLVRVSCNSGPGVARHEGIKACSTGIVAIMDADDVCVGSRFEIQLRELADSSISVVGGLIEEFRSAPGDLRRIREVPSLHADIVNMGRKRFPLNHVTLMFRRKAYLRAGGYGDQRMGEDYDLYFRMMSTGSVFRNVQRVLVWVRSGVSIATRRRGFAYLKGEIALFSRMYRGGYISRARWASNVIARIVARYLPSRLLELLYRSALRAPAPAQE